MMSWLVDVALYANKKHEWAMCNMETFIYQINSQIVNALFLRIMKIMNCENTVWQDICPKLLV